jgi:hypothetical protein
MIRLLFTVFLDGDHGGGFDDGPPRIFYPPRRLWRYIAFAIFVGLLLIATQLHEPWGDYFN